MKVPGTLILNSTIAEPPAGIMRRLHVVGRRGEIAFRPDGVEDLADDVERRDEVRPAVADEQAHRLADLGGQRLVADGRADRAVEHDILRLLVDRLLHAERLQALLAVRALACRSRPA